MSSMYIKWLNFSCDLQSFLHFLSMGLGGIIAIMNSNGDSASPWNGFSQESERQQVSSSLQDSSQYSGRSQ